MKPIHLERPEITVPALSLADLRTQAEALGVGVEVLDAGGGQLRYRVVLTFATLKAVEAYFARLRQENHDGRRQRPRLPAGRKSRAGARR